MNIKVGIDVTEPSIGDVCCKCQQEITGKLYRIYIQVGGPDEVAYLPEKYCEGCTPLDEEESEG